MVLFNNQKFERTRTPPLRQYNFKGFRLEGFERVLFLFISCLFVFLVIIYGVIFAIVIIAPYVYTHQKCHILIIMSQQLWKSDSQYE